MMTTRLNQMLPDLLDMIKRFPVAVIASLGLFIYVNVFVVGHDSTSNFDVVLAFAAFFFAAGAGHLIGEGRGRGSLVLAIALGLMAGALLFYKQFFHASELYVFGGLLPLLMIAPYLHGSAKQGSVWLFNVRLGLAALLALVVGMVFGLGLSAVLAGLHYLFNVGIADTVYQRVWALAVYVIGPLYGLSIIPRNLTEEVDLTPHHGSLLERGVSVLVNYVLVPLVLIYAAILHAYAVKILASGTLPKGQIATIVSLFAVGGTATWLIGWPWRQTGSKLLQVFMRGWFWLLPVPAVLLSLAIWRRVSDYGVTPDRYGVALVAVWTALVFLYLVMRRNRADMRIILGTAAALLLFGSFGPQGANGITGTSQFARLKSFLETKGVLKDGKVVAVLPNLTKDDRSEGYSMLVALDEVHAGQLLKPWFDEGEFAKFAGDKANTDWILTGSIAPKLGMDIYLQNPNDFHFRTQFSVDQTWTGKTRIVGPLSIHQFNSGKLSVKRDVSVRLANNEIRLTVAGQMVAIPITEFLTKAKAASLILANKDNMLPLEINSHVSLLVQQVSGVTGDAASLESTSFWVVVHE